MLFCEEAVYMMTMMVDFFSRFWKESMKKTYNLFREKYDTFFRKRSSLRSSNRSWRKIGLSCFEGGCPQLKLLKGEQNTAVLRCCRPRTSATAICACGNLSDLFLDSSTRSLLLPHIFLHNSFYYIKVNDIASGNKLIKTIRYLHMWRYDIFTCEDIDDFGCIIETS